MANNEGGHFLITESDAKGAAVLSALEVSHNDTSKHQKVSDDTTDIIITDKNFVSLF